MQLEYVLFSIIASEELSNEINSIWLCLLLCYFIYMIKEKNKLCSESKTPVLYKVGRSQVSIYTSKLLR
jgi:hypothetical protein